MKKLLTLAILLGSMYSFAQDEAKVEEPANKLSISGTVDTYFQTNITAPDDLGESFGTAFADQTGFGLGMANLVASYEGESTGAVADLAFGTRGVQAVGGGNDLYINQLYAYWNVSETTTLTVGRFNTFLGYEVISPAANFNYSTSFLFSSGPFSHVGLKADFALSDDVSLMVAGMNATDVNNNTTGDYALGLQLGYSGQYLNFYYDSGIVLGYEIDYTGGFDLADNFFFGINAAYANNDDNGFYGVAFYPQLATSDNFSVGLRGEYFVSYDDIDATDDATVSTVTLTGSYTVDNLIIKPELRLDTASSDAYIDNDALPTDKLAAFTLAAIYKF